MENKFLVNVCRTITVVLFAFLATSLNVQHAAADEPVPTFAPEAVVSDTVQPYRQMVMGDLNNDGHRDIIATAGADRNGTILIWKNPGAINGAWTMQEVGGASDWIISLEVADFDQDGDLDIASGAYFELTNNEVVLWENDGTPFNGTWPSNLVGTAARGVQDIASADFDDDGDLDLVAGVEREASEELLLWENDGTPFDGTWLSFGIGQHSKSIFGLAIVDIDQDDDLDVVTGGWRVGSPSGGELLLWENDGTPFDGLWQWHRIGQMVGDIGDVAVADLDRDGYQDIVAIGSSQEDYEVIAWQHPVTEPFTNTWASQDVGATDVNGIAIALADVNQDGTVDVVSTSNDRESEVEVLLWLNDGTPFADLWQRVDVGDPNERAKWVDTDDVDSDGDLDIVTTSASKVSVWENLLDPEPYAIVFTSSRSGNADIWVTNSAGHAPTQLTTDPAGDIAPRWSPDGSQIAFASHRSGKWEVWVMDADGSNQRQLTDDNPTEYGVGQLSWHPDGSKIRYAHPLATGRGKLVDVALDGTQTDVIDHGSNTYHVDLHSNGRMLFTRQSGSWAPTEEIYTANFDGSDEVRLTNNGFNDSFGRWSPDGSLIAWYHSVNGDGYHPPHNVFVMNSQDGSAQQQLTACTGSDDCVFPAWSPSGAQIVYAKQVSGQRDLWIMDADGTNHSLLLADGTMPDWKSGGDDNTSTIGDIRSDPLRLWTDPVVVYPNLESQLGLVISRVDGQAGIGPVAVRFYHDEIADDNLIGQTEILVLGVNDVATTPSVSWQDPPVGSYPLWAVIDPEDNFAEIDETNNVISRTLTVQLPPADTSPPTIDQLLINEGQTETTAREIALAIQAHDDPNGTGVGQVLYMELHWNPAARAWVPVQNTDWLPFTNASSWELLLNGGLRYIQAWVADGAGNISASPMKAPINYIPEVDTIRAGETRAYRRTLAAGQCLSVRVLPELGDADLYVWPPGFVEGGERWYSILGSNREDAVSFEAPRSGEYQIEVDGFTDAEYQLLIETTDACVEQVQAAAMDVQVKIPRSRPAIPMEDEGVDVSVPPVDVTPQPTETIDAQLFLPLIDE